MDTALSLVHIGAGSAALILGITMLAMRKGTATHRRIGWVYATLMAIALLAILIRTRAAPRPFAGYAVFILLVLATAIASSRRRASVRSWRGWHGGLMLLSLLGASMAAASIGAGVSFGATSGALFYKLFNVIIVLFTAVALRLVWRSRTVWGAHPTEAERAARRRYSTLVAGSSAALVIAQWPLAFP